MKILWLINIPLPEVSILMDEEQNPFGGWLVNTSKYLANQQDIELTVLFPNKKIKSFLKVQGEKIKYYAFKPLADNHKKEIDDNIIFEEIVREVNPDLVHIYGTELAQTLALVNICNKNNIKTVVSIQGLVSIIEKHMLADLSLKAVYGFTLRNLLRKDNVIGLKKLFYKRGKNEIDALKKINYVIGRTNWDEACTSQINPKIKYYFCNEILREEFYHHKWEIEQCEKNSIFLSQGQYPIKGIHYVLEALPLILKRYPNTKVYISGKNITKSDTIKDNLLMTYYGKYIKRLIRKLKIENNVIFTGPLTEKKMCERFLKSHLFISPSTIENESNSLSEARIMGVPSIASYVGGVIDRIENGYDGYLYQHNATYMLAHYACKVFEDEELAMSFSKRSRKKALVTHDREDNTKQLVKIYNDILA